MRSLRHGSMSLNGHDHFFANAEGNLNVKLSFSARVVSCFSHGSNQHKTRNHKLHAGVDMAIRVFVRFHSLMTTENADRKKASQSLSERIRGTFHLNRPVITGAHTSLNTDHDEQTGANSSLHRDAFVTNVAQSPRHFAGAAARGKVIQTTPFRPASSCAQNSVTEHRSGTWRKSRRRHCARAWISGRVCRRRSHRMTHKSQPCGPVSHGSFSKFAATLCEPKTDTGPDNHWSVNRAESAQDAWTEHSYRPASSPEHDVITVTSSQRRDVTH